jgi:hypothetical protein
MKFKAKPSKQGNGYCIYIPVDVRTKLDLNIEYEWEVTEPVEPKKEESVIPFKDW